MDTLQSQSAFLERIGKWASPETILHAFFAFLLWHQKNGNRGWQIGTKEEYMYDCRNNTILSFRFILLQADMRTQVVRMLQMTDLGHWKTPWPCFCEVTEWNKWSSFDFWKNSIHCEWEFGVNVSYCITITSLSFSIAYSGGIVILWSIWTPIIKSSSLDLHILLYWSPECIMKYHFRVILVRCDLEHERHK